MNNPNRKLHQIYISRRLFVLKILPAGVVGSWFAAQRLGFAQEQDITPTPVSLTPSHLSQFTPSASTSAAYGPPSLEESRIPLTTPDNVREALHARGLSDDLLTVYESAVYDWAEVLGYTSDDLTLELVYNGETDAGLRWGIVLRDHATNHLLWTENADASLASFPTLITVNDDGEAFVNTDLRLRRLDGTGSVEVRFTSDGYMKALGGEIFQKGRQFYSQWFDTRIGEFVPIPEVWLLRQIEFQFEGQSEASQLRIWDGAIATVRYLYSLGITDIGAIRTFVYEDKGLIHDDAVSWLNQLPSDERWRVLLDRPGLRQMLTGGEGLTHDYDAVYIWTGQPGGFTHNDEYYFGIGAGLIEPFLEQQAGRRMVEGTDQAAWYVLGTSAYLNLLMMERNGFDISTQRADLVHEATNHPQRLIDMEQYTGSSINFMGIWGVLASEYLALSHPNGARALIDFYRLSLDQNTQWRTNFQRAFDFTVDEFYSIQWAPYRDARYHTYYTLVRGNLYDSAGNPINTAFAWAVPLDWVYAPPPALVQEFIPMYTALGPTPPRGVFWNRLPPGIDCIMYFTRTAQQNGEIVGYWQQTDDTPSRNGRDFHDVNGVITPDRTQATILNLGQDASISCSVTCPIEFESAFHT